MDKPVQLIIADLKSDLTSAVNNAHLPMVCITPAIKELYEQCLLIEKEQFRQARKEYERNLETVNNKNNHENLADTGN